MSDKAHTKYGHWLDPHHRDANRRASLWLMQMDVEKMACRDARIEMVKANEVCCKGHEHLWVAQEIKKEKKEGREREKRKAMAKERRRLANRNQSRNK